MKTVGEILEAARKKKDLTFTQVEKEVKIRQNFLKALEKNEFSKIPGGAIVAKGFITNYGKFLGLSPKKLLASFRRDFTEDEKGQVLPRGYYKPLDSPSFSWTPRLTVITGVACLVVTLFSYLGFQAISFLGKPPLSLSSPAFGQIQSAEIKVSGKTDPDAQVLINGTLTVVNEEGYFEEEVSLLPGENTLTVEAVSRRGKKTKITKKVFFETERGD